MAGSDAGIPIDEHSVYDGSSMLDRVGRRGRPSPTSRERSLEAFIRFSFRRLFPSSSVTMYSPRATRSLVRRWSSCLSPDRFSEEFAGCGEPKSDMDECASTWKAAAAAVFCPIAYGCSNAKALLDLG